MKTGTLRLTENVNAGRDDARLHIGRWDLVVQPGDQVLAQRHFRPGGSQDAKTELIQYARSAGIDLTED